MRALLVLLAIVILALIAAVATGLIDIDQTRKAQSPRVRVEGGQIPTFDVKTPDVSVGSTSSTVTVPDVSIGTKKEEIALPTVSVRKPDQQAPAPAQNHQGE